MAVLHTKRIHICGLKKDRKRILEELQRRGTVQVQREDGEDAVFGRMDTAAAKTRFEKQAERVMEALTVLDAYAPEKKGMFSALEGKKEISAEEYETKVTHRQEYLELSSRLLSLESEVRKTKDEQLRTEELLLSLKPWMELDIPFSGAKTRTAEVFIGALPGKWTAEQLTEKAAEAGLWTVTFEPLSAGADQTCLFAVCLKSEAAVLEELLRTNGFVRTALTAEKTPKQWEAEQQKKLEALKSQETELIERIRALFEHREELKFLSDYCRMRAEKYEILGELLQSSHTFFVNGYVPEYLAEELRTQLERTFSCAVELTEPEEEENAPVLLKNNAFAAPTESVVESFGLPARGEIDPTAIMAVCYYFLFGLMLSDAGYGLIMAAGCLWAVRKFPNMEEGTKKMLKMFFWCGVSTIFWGILFGGFFGDAVDVISSTFFGKEVSIAPLWLAPLEEPMLLLVWCFLFGVIHLFLGLGIKGYLLLRDKKYMDFFANVFCWYLFLISLILMLVPSDLFASLAGSAVVLPEAVSRINRYAAIGSALCIVLFSETGTKNPVLRIALGAYDLYGVSSWLSDVLSYSRLLALGLATGVIASVINTMAAMGGKSVFGVIVFILVFVIGHLLNMAINLLGAYVHTNRLQFVEFFGKFYEGGGQPFQPFSAAGNHYFKFQKKN